MIKSKTLLCFGASLRVLRMQKGFTQEAMALSVGLDRSYYGKVERGETNISLINLLRIAKTLSVTPSTLLQCFNARSELNNPKRIIKSRRGV